MLLVAVFVGGLISGGIGTIVLLNVAYGLSQKSKNAGSANSSDIKSESLLKVKQDINLLETKYDKVGNF